MIHVPFAYVGPGAGFALLSSFLSLLLSLAASLFSLLLWPFRMLRGMLRRERGMQAARVKRVIFLGLDGLDPKFTETLMAEGKLPNLTRLKEQGSYRRLRTTCPPLSRVAWSTFATGVNPGKHSIFGQPGETECRSEPFWKILGRHSVESTLLRIPATFAPGKFDGRMLSTAAIRGGFSWFTTNAEECDRNRLIEVDGVLTGELAGPGSSIPFRLVDPQTDPIIEIQGEAYVLRPREYTPWIRLRFGAVHGIVRFLVTGTRPEFSLYATAVQIDPESPAVAISQPAYYAGYLAKLIGSFSTLPDAEDTAALNAGAIDEDDFLTQANLIQKEREAMFFSALEHQERGVMACVFDTPDRIQDVFYRYLDPACAAARHAGTIERMYAEMDRIVGKTLEHAGHDAAVFTLSGHGFRCSRRSVNLNAWLCRNGYLALEAGEIHWPRTRAYSLALGSLNLNMRGREAHGIVDPKDAPALLAELISQLTGLRDEDSGAIAIQNVYAAREIYRGAYVDAAPDLIVACASGYRAASGSLHVFEDNVQACSGDHCVDPSLVPGVLFSNLKLDTEDPGIEDLAPTALRLFGIQPPEWMDGKSVIHFA